MTKDNKGLRPMSDNNEMVQNSETMPNKDIMHNKDMMQNPSSSNMNAMQGQEMQYKALYPEVFYKVQPYVVMVCDEMENMGNVMPSQEMLENISDNIYEDMREMYPEMAEYMEQSEVAETVVQTYGRRFGRPFRRRGMFRDLIGIMLLSELYGRRRRRYW